MFRSVIRYIAAFAIVTVPLLAGNGASGQTYLALGDSVVFGFNPNLLGSGLPLPTPSEFVGYRETVEKVLRLVLPGKLIDGSCPGETSSSFISGAPPDNGCNGPGEFKAQIGLHTNYSGSQLSFALAQLKSNPHIALVTIGIGGNDLRLLQAFCTGQTVPFAECVEANGPAVVNAFATNLATILTEIRMVYSGRLIVTNVYAPSTDPIIVSTIAAFDTVMARVAGGFGAKIADAFTAFELASALAAHGDPCAAGLLIRLPGGACDVHPSPTGRDVLAATVLFNAIGIR